MSNITIVDHFEIPDELAKELSDLLVTQTIRENILVKLIGDPKYNEVEKSLIEVTEKIDFIKKRITTEFVPPKYNSPEYRWNYEGYEFGKNILQILK